jgi:uncharacterized membrane protein (DUF485 family)
MLFTFPSRYLFTIDLKKYLVLGHSRPGFVRDFTSPVLLKICHRRVKIPFAYGAITRSGRAFQLVSTRELFYVYLYLTLLGSKNNYLATPLKHMDLDPSALPFHVSGWIMRGLRGLDCSPFARHYLGNGHKLTQSLSPA